MSFLALAGGAWGSSGWLVVAGGVEGQFAQEFAGGGVDDADVQVLDQDQDVGSGVGSPDADVVESPVDAQGDHAGVVDAVGADAVVDLAVRSVLGLAIVTLRLAVGRLFAR